MARELRVRDARGRSSCSSICARKVLDAVSTLTTDIILVSSTPIPRKLLVDVVVSPTVVTSSVTVHVNVSSGRKASRNSRLSFWLVSFAG